MKLYKYVVPERVDILHNACIRFTQPGVFNDPFEMQPFYESLAQDEELRQGFNESVKEQVDERLREIYSSLPENARKFLPFEFLQRIADDTYPEAKEHAPELANAFMPIVRNVLSSGWDDHIGVLSLTERPDNLLMWAHYAQNHQGFTIEFNSEHKYFRQQRSPVDEFGHLRKVEYSIYRPHITITKMNSTEIFLVKSKEWEYEQEWRMLRPLKESNGPIITHDRSIHLFSIPPECITGIILGCRMRPEQREKILRFVCTDKRYSHINRYRSFLHEQEFKLNIVPAEI
jgi:DUF2971 family protein